MLKNVWRHTVVKHGTVFLAVANLEQLQIRIERTWQVEYYDSDHNDFDV